MKRVQYKQRDLVLPQPLSVLSVIVPARERNVALNLVKFLRASRVWLFTRINEELSATHGNWEKQLRITRPGLFLTSFHQGAVVLSLGKNKRRP